MSRETLRQTALRFIDIFMPLEVKSPESLFTPTYQHQFRPASLSGLPQKNGQEFAAHLASLKDVLKEFPVTPRDIFIDEPAKRVVVWATSETHFHENAKDDGIPADEWLFHGEYVFMFTMDESGQRVDKVVEFLDSKATDSLIALMKRARGNIK